MSSGKITVIRKAFPAGENNCIEDAVPGAGLVCLGVVLETLHVPVEAIGLIIAVDPILDMFVTMSNTTGDVAAALIVAKSEKLLDEDVYNDKTRT